MATIQNIPQLRFPGFEGEWSKDIFGRFVIHSAFGPRFSSDLYGNKGNIATLRTTDMDLEGNICYETMPLANLEYDQIKDHILESNDIVISRSGTIGITGVFKNFKMKVVPGAFLIRFRVDSKKISTDFIKFQFNSSKGRNSLNTLSAGGVQKNLTGTSVKQLEITLPTLPEQQKIASFLSSVDEKIQQLSRKKELLGQYKKGLMQQLFSRKLRFKDENGNEYPDWEEKMLGDTLEITIDNRGKTPPTLAYGIPLLEVNSIGNKEIKYQVVSKFVTDETFHSWFRKYLKKGDVLFSTVGNTALCSYYDGKIKACIAQNIVGLRFKNDISLFMYYLLIEERNNNKFKQIEMGAVQPSVKVSQMVDLLFDIPCILEQQKIANFLSGIDVKIENTGQEINAMQGFKKGLLQQMFV